LRILVTGSKGMLGHDLVRVLSTQHQVIATDIDDLDITNLDQTIDSIRRIAPKLC
jgi:dTDP-4-dehydrorhamnose reductase